MDASGPTFEATVGGDGFKVSLLLLSFFGDELLLFGAGGALFGLPLAAEEELDNGCVELYQ